MCYVHKFFKNFGLILEKKKAISLKLLVHVPQTYKHF